MDQTPESLSLPSPSPNDLFQPMRNSRHQRGFIFQAFAEQTRQAPAYPADTGVMSGSRSHWLLAHLWLEWPDWAGVTWATGDEEGQDLRSWGALASCPALPGTSGPPLGHEHKGLNTHSLSHLLRDAPDGSLLCPWAEKRSSCCPPLHKHTCCSCSFPRMHTPPTPHPPGPDFWTDSNSASKTQPEAFRPNQPRHPLGSSLNTVPP